MTHTLKTWPEYFKLIKEDRKKWELRKDDRDFNVGDTLILQEFNPDGNTFTGEEIHKIVTFILDDTFGFGLKKGYIIMSIEDKPDYK